MTLAFPDADMPITAEAAFGADLTAAPGTWAYTDLSSRVLDSPMQKRQGRSAGAKTADAKSCTITLDNDDGELTPLNPMSTLWPDVILGIPFRITINPTGTPTAWCEGFVASWTPDVIATVGGTTAVIRVTVAGRLRERSQGEKPLRSALYRSMAGVAAGDYVPHAYWAMEDGSDATQFASGLPGGVPMAFTGSVTLASDSTLAGSDPLPVFAVGASTMADIPSYTDTGAWVVQYVMKMTATSSSMLEIKATGTARRIVVGTNFATSEFSVTMYNSAGSSIYSITWPWQVALSGQWVSFNFGMSNSGTDQYNMEWHVLGDPVTYGAGDLVASSKGRITRVKASAGTAAATFGHVGVYTDPSFSQGIDGGVIADAMTGWAGETAHARFERLCNEESIPVTITGSTSAPMGPQMTGTLLENLRDCETTGVGVMGESGFGLSYVCLAERYNVTPQLTVDLSTYDTMAGTERQVFTPAFDDQRYRNQWTVDRPNGSSYVASSAITAIYEDFDTVNVESDDQLPDQAWWRHGRDSRQAYRYQSTPIDLTANPALIDNWLALSALDLGLGQMVRTNPPSQHPLGDIPEMVDGWTETLSRRKWSVAVMGSPAEPYTVAVLDSATYGKADTAGSELHSAATSVATSLDVATTSGPLWTSADAEDGFDWRIGGERVTVTDIAASLVTYGAVGTAAHGNNASVVPSLPGSLAAGNLMVMLAAIRNSGAGVPSTPAGWTRWDVFQSTDNVQVFAKIAGSSESAPTVSFTGGVANADTSAQIIRLGGKWHSADFALLSKASCLNASAQNIGYPGLSLPAADNCIILVAAWKQDDFTSVATLGGMTEIAEASTTTGDDQSLVWDYVIQTTAAYIPAGSFTVTGGASAISRGGVMAIRCDYQTATVTRSVNGVVKAQVTGEAVNLWTPARGAL